MIDVYPEYRSKELDFEKISTQYDAVYISMSQDFDVRQTFNGMDVSSLIVCNPNAIEIVFEKDVIRDGMYAYS